MHKPGMLVHSFTIIEMLERVSRQFFTATIISFTNEEALWREDIPPSVKPLKPLSPSVAFCVLKY